MRLDISLEIALVFLLRGGQKRLDVRPAKKGTAWKTGIFGQTLSFENRLGGHDHVVYFFRIQGCVAYLVQDAGYTQIPAGSRTILGVFGPVEAVDSVTGSLKLLWILIISILYDSLSFFILARLKSLFVFFSMKLFPFVGNKQ